MKEPLVLIPGMMCDGRLFTPQAEVFSAQRPVLTAPPIGDDTMSGLARRILNIAPPEFALAGLSMGGIVAMEIIRQAPERVTRLALMDTNPLPDPAERAATREAQVRKVEAGGLRSVMRDEMKPHYLADGKARADLLVLCMSMAEELGAEVFADQSRAVQTRPDQRDTLRSISVPTLVLCGEEDRLCPIERHRLMHVLINRSRLEIIAGAGHLPTLEQPQRTNRALEQWLRTKSSKTC